MSEHAIGEQGTDPSLQAPKSYWEEEGLIWRGPRAPSLREAHKLGESWTVDDWMEMPHEHYIPISKYQLQEVLWDYDKVQQHRAQFKHLLVRMESIYHFHYHKLLNALKSDYEFFDPDKGERRRDNVSEEELKFRERRFLNNLMRTMARGNFVSFDHEFLEYAGKYDYLFDLASEFSSEESLNDNTTAQYKALQWLAFEDPAELPIKESNTSTLIERYAAAVFYYSTGGEMWTDEYNWMSNDTLCDWNNGQFGFFCGNFISHCR